MANPLKISKPSWTIEEVNDLVRLGSPGRRVFALTLMRGEPRLRQLDLLTELIEHSRSAFEQYSALEVLEKMAFDLAPADRASVRVMLQKERDRYITPGSDRELLCLQIEARLDEADRPTATKTMTTTTTKTKKRRKKS
jgi:hypothetical protein